MPPHLHPRSSATSSLFATTLLASFVVVGLPHLLPCPAPRVRLADAQQAQQQQEQKAQGHPKAIGSREKPTEVKAMTIAHTNFDDERTHLAKRECPVPKPGTIAESIMSLGHGKENK